MTKQEARRLCRLVAMQRGLDTQILRIGEAPYGEDYVVEVVPDDQTIASFVSFSEGEQWLDKDNQNAQRRQRGMMAIDAYVNANGLIDEPMTETLADLLADLMHAADLLQPQLGMPFEDIYARAEAHFSVEKGESLANL